MKLSKRRVQTNIATVLRNGELKFGLDAPAWTQDASKRIVVSGWIVHQQKLITEVRLRTRRGPIASTSPNIPRQGVANVYPGYPNSGMPGFKIECPSPGKGVLVLEVVFEGGHSIEFAEMTLETRKQPRIFFMHIPKTAGSAFNHWLASHCERGRYEVHVESQEGWFSDVEYFRNLDFLSGHFALSSFERKLDISGYYSITMLREPYAQVASHLAWIRKLSDEGEERRFHEHPQYIQVLSRKLSQVDFTNADELRELVDSLESEQRLLISNCQLRYFTDLSDGEQVQEKHLERAIAASRKFTRIGRTEKSDIFVARIARDFGWHQPGLLKRENVSSSLYGLDLGEESTRRALEPLVRYDLMFLARIEKDRIEKDRKRA